MFINIGSTKNNVNEIASICYANNLNRADNSYNIIVVLKNNTHVTIYCSSKSERDSIMDDVSSQLLPVNS